MMRRKRPMAEDELFPELIDVLVEGWCGSYTWDTPTDRALDCWLFSDEQLRDLADRHRDRLTREARRRGLARPVYLDIEQ